MCGNNGFDILSVVAIGVSIATVIWQSYKDAKFNKINLNAEFFKQLFFDRLLKNIPKERDKLEFNANGKLCGYKKFVNCFLKILSDSAYYKYKDKKYYEDLKECIWGLEDYVFDKANQQINSEEQKKVFDNIDKKMSGIYKLMTDKYEKG